jgi:acetolactate synthase-1/2/3 large subunit
MTGAQALVRALETLGVDVVFGLPGVHNLPLWEALAASDIRLVGSRHEQGAVYAADGLARTTGQLGIALTTTGPGAANTLGATGEAWSVGSPVIVIATDIATSLRRPGAYRGALHETRDQGAMFRPVVKRVVRVRRGDDIEASLLAAADAALAAPSGPIYVEIPTDLLSAPQGTTQPIPSVKQPPLPDRRAIRDAAELLRAARRPLMWVGGGAVHAGAGAAVAAVAERLGAPVIETYGARGLVPLDHPCWIGLPPHVEEVGRLWDEADVVLAVGTDFDGMMTQNWRMPQPPTLIAINADGGEAAKSYTAAVALVADARHGLEALAEHLPARPVPAALSAQLAAIRAATRRHIAADEPAALELLDAVQEAVAPHDAAVFADMCIPGYWVAGFHAFAAPRRLGYPVGWGTLGFGFPASLGAAVAGERPVLCITGDGGMMFALGELATVAQERIPVTILLVDDGGYGMLRFDQVHAGTQTFGVDLQSPDWAGLAASFGIATREVAGFGAPLGSVLRELLGEGEPSLVVARASLRPPVTTSPRWYRPAAPSAGVGAAA